MKQFVLATFLLVSFNSMSQGFGISNEYQIPKGLEEGSIAPRFEGTDQNGKKISLDDRLRKGPVVLIFYRGYWCPVCNRHLSAFENSLSKITDKGASVIAITPENNDGVEKTINKSAVSFSILSDADYSIMDQYEVRFLVTDQYNRKIKTFKGIGIDENNSDDKPYLPVPATYIIGQDGKIIKTFFDENYKNRPTAEEIAKFL